MNVGDIRNSIEGLPDDADVLVSPMYHSIGSDLSVDVIVRLVSIGQNEGALRLGVYVEEDEDEDEDLDDFDEDDWDDEEDEEDEDEDEDEDD